MINTSFIDGDIQVSLIREDAPKCVTNELLTAMENAQDVFIESGAHYLIIGSEDTDIFNLGGDLAYMARLIREQKRDELGLYAYRCTQLVYQNFTNFGNSELTTISLFRGAAMGGGAEAILSSNIVIAEPNATIHFPEWMFFSFPAMGALQILESRAGKEKARRIITAEKPMNTGLVYSHNLIHAICARGHGMSHILDRIKLLKKQKAAWSFINSFHTSPFGKWEHWLSCQKYWTDQVMKLDEPALRLMERMSQSQNDT